MLAGLLLLLLNIDRQPTLVIAGKLMPTEVSLHMRIALVDGQKVNSYHSIGIHTHASVENEYGVSSMEVKMEIHMAGCN